MIEDSYTQHLLTKLNEARQENINLKQANEMLRTANESVKDQNRRFVRMIDERDTAAQSASVVERFKAASPLRRVL